MVCLGASLSSSFASRTLQCRSSRIPDLFRFLSEWFVEKEAEKVQVMFTAGLQKHPRKSNSILLLEQNLAEPSLGL